MIIGRIAAIPVVGTSVSMSLGPMSMFGMEPVASPEGSRSTNSDDHPLRLSRHLPKLEPEPVPLPPLCG